MNKDQPNLPMAGAGKSLSCTPDDGSSIINGDPAGSNWVTGRLETVSGPVCRVSTSLDGNDLLGMFKMRLSLGRMKYHIPPALYAIGNPDSASPVLVSADYKLSFDHLRRELEPLSLWILVLDTKGINVWCAAGKGSFSTAEVVRMVKLTGLKELVSHRSLILPQLAAPGVSAHEVRQQTGFKVTYGPVRAVDLPAFIKAGNKATPEMRSTKFRLPDRLVLVPVELVGMIVPLFIFTAAILILNLAALLVRGTPVSPAALMGRTMADLAPFAAAMLIGIILVPALLPYIPGRAFAWKGWLLGFLWALTYTMLIMPGSGWLLTAAYLLIIPALTAFIGMNFTGSTTYTSLSGVLREMGIALPLIIITAFFGLIARIAAYFII